MINQLDFESNGVCIYKSFLSEEEVIEVREILNEATIICQSMQKKSGLINITSGSSHHLPVIDRRFLNIINSYKKLDSFITSLFGGKYILNSFGGNLNVKETINYASNIHRDQRFFSGTTLILLNTFIALCDFTVSNGATRILTKDKYFSTKKPDQSFFDENSIFLEIKAGSLCLFNSNLWHAAGNNLTSENRPIITPMFSRPFFKQQFDYSRLVEPNDSNFLKQILGFYSRVPSDLLEWYAPTDQRCYLAGQDYDF
tara:strand:+ start:192 stop:962 length:771 start_codon:yes stop_codon:yes gene_type:complete